MPYVMLLDLSKLGHLNYYGKVICIRIAACEFRKSKQLDISLFMRLNELKWIKYDALKFVLRSHYSFGIPFMH